MSTQLKNALGQVYYEVQYDAENNWVYSNWKGYVTLQEVKDGANAALAHFEKHKCTNLLNDNSELEGPWDDANDWIANDWMPRALAAGLAKFAHIVSPDVFGQLSAEALVTRVQGFEMRIFGSRREAQEWLRQPVLA
ncbi:MAG: STAS/SEC14 domain-containing protein [Cytophagales bacterium]|jgi:hypothetical protein|nr:STAS/SEC14 domain-containing protein [Cytophagales bacterium]